MWIKFHEMELPFQKFRLAEGPILRASQLFVAVKISKLENALTRGQWPIRVASDRAMKMAS